MTLRFDEIAKSFGKQRVLRGVSLTCQPGRVTFVMGGSGAGKSVLARVAVGLVQPDSGRAMLDDFDLGTLDAEGWRWAHRRCQLVFQQAPLLDGLTARENVGLVLRRCLGLTSPAAQRRADELLNRLHAGHVADCLPSALSTAMRKQVAIARALALEPRVLIYDEPTTGLDPVTARRIDRVIAEVAAQGRITTMVVSHDLQSLRAVADTVAFLHGGTIVFDGTPNAFFASEVEPVHAFVHSAQSHPALY